MATEVSALPCDDPVRMGQFLSALEPRMVGVARRMVREPEAAADIVQNAFEKVLRCCRQFRGTSRPSTWVHRIVINEALQWLRSRTRRAPERIDPLDWELAVGRRASLDEHVAAQEDRRRLGTALDTLSEDDRELLIASVVEGRSMKSLRGRFGISEAGLKTRAFRARRQLARVLSARRRADAEAELLRLESSRRL